MSESKNLGAWAADRLTICFYVAFGLFCVAINFCILSHIVDKGLYRSYLSVLMGVLLFIFAIILSAGFNSERRLNKLVVYPAALFFVAMFMNLWVMFFLGHTPLQIHDMQMAWLDSFQDPRDFKSHYAWQRNLVFTHWLVYSRFMAFFHQFSTHLAMPGYVNVILASFSSMFVYYLVLLASDKTLWAALSSLLFIFFPSRLICIIIYQPDQLHITLLLLACILAVISFKKNGWLLAAVSGLVFSLSCIFKNLGELYLIAILIVLTLSLPKLIPADSLGRSRFINICAAMKLPLILCFLIMYILGGQLWFSLLDRCVGKTVARSAATYFIATGLNTERGGWFAPKVYIDYLELIEQHSTDLERVDEIMREKYLNEENFKNLNFSFFVKKFKFAWESTGLWMRPILATSLSIKRGEKDDEVFNGAVWATRIAPLHEVYYYLVCFTTLVGAVAGLKKRDSNILLFSGLAVFGLILLLLISETSYRYKYEVFHSMCIISAYGLIKVGRFISEKAYLILRPFF